jgi:hypothetical protein
MPFDDSECGTASPHQKRKAAPRIMQDVLTLVEGRVVFQWPEKLSKASTKKNPGLA